MLRRLAALAILALLAPASIAADVVRCRLVRIAEWPVRFERDLPLIDGAINGKKISVLLDTGAYASILTKAAADRLGLATRGNYESMVGFGGESEITTARLDELHIAGAVRNNVRVRVGGERPIPGVDFILGDDFFRNADIEFHYSEGVVRIYQARDCAGTPLAYWDRSARSVAMEDDSKVVIAIRVNGRDALALLDSGASSSVVSLNFAAKLGITPQSPNVIPGGCSRGLGAGEVRSWIAPFETIELAGEVIRDARIAIADFIPELAHVNPEVILGTDFLRTHRVLVSRSQRKVYFTNVSGPVFPARKSSDCR
jgi:predicted aspartyl protease